MSPGPGLSEPGNQSHPKKDVATMTALSLWLRASLRPRLWGSTSCKYPSADGELGWTEEVRAVRSTPTTLQSPQQTQPRWWTSFWTSRPAGRQKGLGWSLGVLLRERALRGHSVKSWQCGGSGRPWAVLFHQVRESGHMMALEKRIPDSAKEFHFGRHAYTKKLLVYLKFKFGLMSHIAIFIFAKSNPN